jgi:DNA replication protein DnaC
MAISWWQAFRAVLLKRWDREKFGQHINSTGFHVSAGGLGCLMPRGPRDVGTHGTIQSDEGTAPKPSSALQSTTQKEKLMHKEELDNEEGLTEEEAAHKETERIIEEEQRKEDRLIGERWERLGLPARFKSMSFASSPMPGPIPKLISRMVEEAPTESWVLYGDLGRGKTGMAVSILRAMMGTGETKHAIFSPVPSLLSELRSTYNRSDGPTEFEIIERHVEAGVLILDDLGAEHVRAKANDDDRASWLQDVLYQIIGGRHAEMRTTIITTNLNVRTLNSESRVGGRVVQRIVESCRPDHIIELKGANLRVK